MVSKSKKVLIPGSEKAPLKGARAIGPVPSDELIEVTVRLKPQKPVETTANSDVFEDVLPKDRHYLTQRKFSNAHGADPDDMAKIEAFAKEHGLTVVDSSILRRSVILSGTAAQLSAAFGTSLQVFDHPQGQFRGRSGGLTVPGEVADAIDGIFGLDNRPVAKPHFQRIQTPDGVQARAASYTPPQLAKLYNFPPGLDGTGQCIALIELGGGYRLKDIKAYFKELNLPVPKVKSVRVDGGKNHPTNANSADGEVMLDIEVAAAVAPKATIVVYFAPNTDRGFLDAITRAIHDTTNKPSVISISWGGPEDQWTAQSLQQFNQAFQSAAALGVTVCCAAGDNGSGDGDTDGKAHVDFPASSPYVLGCGGTKLVASAGKISAETVWNENANSATGGGVSAAFTVPSYQKSAHVPTSANPGGGAGRGVPDVGGDADPNTGYLVRVDGQEFPIGGTSAVAPLYAGLIALINQKLGKPVGFLNPLIYGSLNAKHPFNDITRGNNGAYSARTGWDACTGWGSPKGATLLSSLGG
jgi:kumamolisin